MGMGCVAGLGRRRRTAGIGLLATCGVAAIPAAAQIPDLDVATLRQAPEPIAILDPAPPRGTALALTDDRFDVAVHREPLLRVTLHPVTVSTLPVGSRARHLPSRLGLPVAYAARLQRFALDVPVGAGLRLQSHLQTLRLRRPTIGPTTMLGRSGRGSVIGVGLASSDGPAINVSYVRFGSLDRRRLIEQTVAPTPGASLAGRGVRLGLAGRAASVGSHGLKWDLSLAAITRPSAASAMAVAADTVTDHRAELSIKLGL